MTTTALIDADTLIYEASLASEQSTEWEHDIWTLHAELGDAKEHFARLVSEIQEATGAKRMILALSDGDNAARWRNKVMPTYKMNRKRVRRPVVYVPLRQFCHETFETFERPTLEGDDVLGILMTHPSLVKGKKVCVSIDKDMKTIPGEHYNYGKKMLYDVSTTEADYNHFLQTLTGDSTDGYAGCPGIGPKRAADILADWYDMEPGAPSPWPLIVAAYKSKGLSEEVALMNARVARICRHTDYDFKTKEVVLWEPEGRK